MTTRSAQASSEQRYYYGTGKRKNAVAQVRLYPGGGEVVINGRSLEQALPWVTWQSAALEPLQVSDNLGKFTVVAKCHGGGLAAWGDGPAPRHCSRPARLRSGSAQAPAKPRNADPRRSHQGTQKVRPEAGPPRPAIHQALARRRPFDPTPS